MNDLQPRMPTDDESLAGAVRDLASRVPAYAKLSASLMREGAMTARSRSPLTQVLGEGGFGRVARWVTQLRRLDQTLMSIGASRSARDEMHGERDEKHLQPAGLPREQIERDYAMLTSIG